MAPGFMEAQLRESCRLTGAAWAVLLEDRETEWNVCASYRLNRAGKRALNDFLKHPKVNDWIHNATTGKHPRPYLTRKEDGLSCRRLYVFSDDQAPQRVILVGAGELSSLAQRFWHLTTLCDSITPAEKVQPQGQNNGIPGQSREVNPNLPQAFSQLLESVAQLVPCQGAWLAVRAGDVLEVRAQKNCLDRPEWQIRLDENPLLQRVRKTRTGVMVTHDSPDWPLVPPEGLMPSTRVWAAQPLLIGQRLIGILAVWREKPFRPREWQSLDRLTAQITPDVEESITFASVTEQMSRMALLNDFALTVSSAQDLDQVAQRVFALLNRAFGTRLINLFLLSLDNTTIDHYSDQDGAVVLHTFPWHEIPSLHAVRRGDIVRLDDIEATEFKPSYDGSRSALLVPLRYRRQVIGALGLESLQAGAFSIHDEHLLVVIASHLAGLVENGRLRQESEARVRNLSLIHEVVQQVIGLTDVREVAQITADLLVQNFAYELAVVMLPVGPNGELIATGIGGDAAGIVKDGLSTASNEGITNRVFVTGQNMLVNDVSQDLIYAAIPGWEAGSEMCVALREGDEILGIIDVESRHKNAFVQNDFLMLESLAGILATVISRVGQYQKLQITVKQLQTTREELQERIAAQRMAEGRLIQAAKMAAVGEMAAGIAHELNNPLTTVSGFTELVLEELPKDAHNRSDLELVLREAYRARDVVRRLLDFARQSESVRVRADVNEIVNDVLALTNHLLHTSGIEVSKEFSGKHPWIPLDRNQIKQVLLNLLHNSLHAMPTGGKISIKTATQERDGSKWITIAIRDTGTGIPPENLEHLFEPFFTTRSQEGGTGLGLSVSYGIVVDHGGFIDAESTVGKGSCFTVWLPVGEE